MKVLFSCQNSQELEDLSLVAERLRRDGFIPVLYDLSKVSGDDFRKEVVDTFPVVCQGISLFSESFRDLSVGKKVVVALVNAINLVRICVVLRCSTCVIGVPLLIYRLAGFLGFGRIRFVSYIRGIIAQSGDDTSSSSKIFRRISWLCVGPLRRVVSDYYADCVVCIGEVTRRFVEERRVPKENVKVLGSIYCDSRFLCDDEGQSRKGRREFVFLSSAFSAHGYQDSQISQSELIVNIFTYLKDNYSAEDFDFVVRKHPRERVEDYRGILEKGVRVDDSGGDAVRCYSKSACFISPISTLLFELAYLGRAAVLVSNSHFLARHAEWYEKINARPVVDWEGMLEYLMRHDPCPQAYGFDLDEVISTKNKGSVIESFSFLIAGYR